MRSWAQSPRLFVLFPALPVSNDLVAYSGFCELLSVFLQLALMPAVTRPVVRVDPAGYEAVKLSAPLPLTLRTRLLPEDNLNDSRDAFLAAIHQWAAGLACPGLDDVSMARKFAHPERRFMVMNLEIRDIAHAAVTASITADGLLNMPASDQPLWTRPVEVTWAQKPLPTRARDVGVPSVLGFSGVRSLLEGAGYLLEACAPAQDSAAGMSRAGAVDVIFSADNRLPLLARVDGQGIST